MHPAKITLASLQSLASGWVSSDGSARVSVLPRGDVNDNLVLEGIRESRHQGRAGRDRARLSALSRPGRPGDAFIEVGIWALVSIAILLYAALRR